MEYADNFAFMFPDVSEFGSPDAVRMDTATGSVPVRAFYPPSYRSNVFDNKRADELEKQVRATLRDIKRHRRTTTDGERSDSSRKYDKEYSFAPGFASTSSAILADTFHLNSATRGATETIHDLSARMLNMYRGNVVSSDLFDAEALNASVQEAHNEFISTLSLVKACEMLRARSQGERGVHRATDMTAAFLRNKGAPFAWTSSRSFCGGVVSPVYETYVPKEHCIMLGWRAAMIAMRTSAHVFNSCEDYRSFYEYKDGEYDERRRCAVNLIAYAIVIVENFILTLITQQCGHENVQATTLAAAALPEMRIGVVGAFLKLARGFLTTIVIDHYSYIAIKADTQLTYAGMRWRSRAYGDREVIVSEEKELCYDLVNTALGSEHAALCAQMRSAAFVYFHEALQQLTEHAWHNNLFDTMSGVRAPGNAFPAFASPAHRAAFEWFVECTAKTVKSKTRVNEHMCSAYNKAAPARAMRHLLAGSAVAQEVFMNAYALSNISEDDPSAIMRASIAVQKIEIILSPIYARRRSAFEMLAWIAGDIEDRSEFNEPIVRYIRKNNAAYQRGRKYSLIEAFTRPSMLGRFQRHVKGLVDGAETDAARLDGSLCNGSGGGGDAEDLFDDTQRYADVGSAGVSLYEISKKASGAFLDTVAGMVTRRTGGDAGNEDREEQSSLTAADYDYNVSGLAKTQRVIPLSKSDVKRFYTVYGAYDDEEHESGNIDESLRLRGVPHCYSDVTPNYYLPPTIRNLIRDTCKYISEDVAMLARRLVEQ